MTSFARTCVLGALTALGLASLLLVKGDGDPTDALPGPALADLASPLTASISEREAVPTPAPPRADTRPRPAEVAFRGRVAWKDDDAPLAGIAVEVTAGWLDTVLPDLELAPPQVSARALARTETDAAGRFALPPLPAGRELFLRVDPGGNAAHLHRLDRALWPDVVHDLGTIAVDRRGSIRGRVVDEQGRPVAQARVRAVDLPLDSLIVDPQRRERQLEGAQEVGQAHLLADAEALGPVPAWFAARDRTLPFPEALTDASGAFTLAAVRPGLQRLVAQPPQLADLSQDVTVELGRVTDVGALVARQGVHFPVIVTEHDRPVPGVLVTAMALTQDHAMRHRDRPGDDALPALPVVLRPPLATDDDGKVTLAGLGDGWHTLVLLRQEGWPWESYSPNEQSFGRRERGAPRPVHVELRDLERARIAVTDEHGAPLAARVELFAAPGPLAGEPLPLAEPLQPRGKAPGPLEARLPPGAYVLAAQAPGRTPALLLWRVPDAPTLRVALRPVAPLHVKVLDDAGRLVPGARLLARTGEDALLRELDLGCTDDQGELVAARCPPRPLTIVADHPAFVRATAAAAADSAVVTLTRASSITGAVTEQGKAPAERWLVVAERAAEPGRRIATTGQDGAFALHQLPPGEWRLTLALPGEAWLGRRAARDAALAAALRRERRSSEVTVWTFAGSSVHQPIELHPLLEESLAGTAVSGTVQVDGLGRADLVVKLTATEPKVVFEALSRRGRESFTETFTRSVVTDPAGRFALRSVPRGAYTLELLQPERRGARRLWQHTVQVERGTPAPIDVQLWTGSARALLRDAQGNPQPDTPLVLAASGAELHAVTNASGHFELLDVPEGTYEVRRDAAPAQAGRGSLRVVRGVLSSATLTLR